jgi:hypothetical protein
VLAPAANAPFDVGDTQLLRSARHGRFARGYNWSMSPTHSRPEAAKSGRVLVRMPESMHAYLSEAAGAEGVSMNLFICSILAMALDWRNTRAQRRPIDEVRQEIRYETWMDRLRRGEVRLPGAR